MNTETLIISLQDVMTESSAEVLGQRPEDCSLFGFSYDSRKACAGSIFVAINGLNVDGHDFISGAIQNGCNIVLGDNPEKLRTAAEQFRDSLFLIVPNVQETLHKLASLSRRKEELPCIGITGACGKTSTKDLTNSILSSSVSTLATPLNNNNLWGLPQCLIERKPSHKVLVLELGTNASGEVKKLAEISKPNITYTTSIGPSHLEFLIDEKGVLAAETEHIQWMLENNIKSTFVINIDDPQIAGFYASIRRKISNNNKQITVSAAGKLEADVRITKKKQWILDDTVGWEISWSSPWGRGSGLLPLPGEYNIANALGAITVALETGLCDMNNVVEGLKKPVMTPLRSDISRLGDGGALLFNDSYNANPLSMRKAFETAVALKNNADFKVNNLVAVVGDMLEMGEKSADCHEELGSFAKKLGFNELLTVGAFSHNWKAGFGASSNSFESKLELVNYLKEHSLASSPNTLILIKASHSPHFEEIAAMLQQ